MSEKIELTVEALRELLRRADTVQFNWNLPYRTGMSYQRCVRMFTDFSDDPMVTAELLEDGRIVQRVVFPLLRLFELWPLLQQALGQATRTIARTRP